MQVQGATAISNNETVTLHYPYGGNYEPESVVYNVATTSAVYKGRSLYHLNDEEVSALRLELCNYLVTQVDRYAKTYGMHPLENMQFWVGPWDSMFRVKRVIVAVLPTFISVNIFMEQV